MLEQSRVSESSVLRQSGMSEVVRARPGVREKLQGMLPKIVLSPTLAITMIFVYGFIVWTAYLSFTKSGMITNYQLAGWKQYIRLWYDPVWYVALRNLFIFGGLYIGVCTVLGLLLAILLDQRIRAEGVLRTIYLYPMALSFIVTGVAWKWMLNPGLGIQKLVQGWGWAHFHFNWIIDPRMAIYAIVVAAVWQSSGFVMAMFLAGLRGVDSEIVKAAAIDGASLPRTYWRIIIPMMRPVFFTSFVVLAYLTIKTFDLVVAMTGGGPGYSTALPATYMYDHTFTRNQIGVGAASAVMMLMTVAAIMIPYLYSELKGGRGHG